MDIGHLKAESGLQEQLQLQEELQLKHRQLQLQQQQLQQQFEEHARDSFREISRGFSHLFAISDAEVSDRP